MIPYRQNRWFYYCFEWYIQLIRKVVRDDISWFYYCFEWYIQQPKSH